MICFIQVSGKTFFCVNSSYAFRVANSQKKNQSKFNSLHFIILYRVIHLTPASKAELNTQNL